MKLILTFGGFPDGRGAAPRMMRVRFESDGVETKCEILKKGLVSGWACLSTGATYLGKGDTFSFNAGCRISFDRAWRALDWQAFAPEFVKELRRAVQIELAIAKVDRKGRALDKAMHRAAREYAALLAMRANGYRKPTAYSFEEALAEVSRRVEAYQKRKAEKTDEGDVSQGHGDPQAKEPLRKPILVGVTDDILPPECAECHGEAECCTKHGGVV